MIEFFSYSNECGHFHCWNHLNSLPSAPAVGFTGLLKQAGVRLGFLPVQDQPLERNQPGSWGKPSNTRTAQLSLL